MFSKSSKARLLLLLSIQSLYSAQLSSALRLRAEEEELGPADFPREFDEHQNASSRNLRLLKHQPENPLYQNWLDWFEPFFKKGNYDDRAPCHTADDLMKKFVTQQASNVPYGHGGPLRKRPLKLSGMTPVANLEGKVSHKVSNDFGYYCEPPVSDYGCTRSSHLGNDNAHVAENYFDDPCICVPRFASSHDGRGRADGEIFAPRIVMDQYKGRWTNCYATWTGGSWRNKGKRVNANKCGKAPWGRPLDVLCQDGRPCRVLLRVNDRGLGDFSSREYMLLLHDSGCPCFMKGCSGAQWDEWHMKENGTTNELMIWDLDTVRNQGFQWSVSRPEDLHTEAGRTRTVAGQRYSDEPRITEIYGRTSASATPDQRALAINAKRFEWERGLNDCPIQGLYNLMKQMEARQTEKDAHRASCAAGQRRAKNRRKQEKKKDRQLRERDLELRERELAERERRLREGRRCDEDEYKAFLNDFEGKVRYFGSGDGGGGRSEKPFCRFGKNCKKLIGNAKKQYSLCKFQHSTEDLNGAKQMRDSGKWVHCRFGADCESFKGGKFTCGFIHTPEEKREAAARNRGAGSHAGGGGGRRKAWDSGEGDVLYCPQDFTVDADAFLERFDRMRVEEEKLRHIIAESLGGHLNVFGQIIPMNLTRVFHRLYQREREVLFERIIGGEGGRSPSPEPDRVVTCRRCGYENKKSMFGSASGAWCKACTLDFNYREKAALGLD